MIKKITKNSRNPLLSFNKTQLKNRRNLAQNYQESLEQKNNEKKLKDQEKLDQAKKESIAKASLINDSMAVRKLMLHTIAKYFLMIALLTATAMLVIKAGPIILKAIHGLISKFILYSLR